MPDLSLILNYLPGDPIGLARGFLLLALISATSQTIHAVIAIDRWWHERVDEDEREAEFVLQRPRRLR